MLASNSLTELLSNIQQHHYVIALHNIHVDLSKVLVLEIQEKPKVLYKVNTQHNLVINKTELEDGFIQYNLRYTLDNLVSNKTLVPTVDDAIYFDFTNSTLYIINTLDSITVNKALPQASLVSLYQDYIALVAIALNKHYDYIDTQCVRQMLKYKLTVATPLLS